jgi:hypothetical protein
LQEGGSGGELVVVRVQTSDVQLLDFVNDRLFSCILYFGNIKEPAVSMKELAKNQQLKKFFFFNLKKIENLGSTPKPGFRSFSPHCVYTEVIISKYV